MTNQTTPVPDRITLTRDQLAALLAHHADVLASSFQTDATTGLPERAAGLGRAVELLGLHAEHLTAEEEKPGVAELLDSMLSFRSPAAEAQQEVCGKCRQPFDSADSRFDGRARFYLTPYCRGCVDRCHDTEIADHRCVICQTAEATR